MKSGEVELIGNTLRSLVECKENGEVLSKLAPPSIYMVPSLVRDFSPTSYTPRVVAIGPLHREDEHLKAFEVQKTTYFYNWLYRLGRAPEQTMGECLQKVIGSIESVKACYAGSMIYGNFELAKMMVIDACFILEFIQSLSERLLSTRNKLITRSIVNDMLLIENQIPFFILEKVFECTLVASRELGKGFSLAMHLKELRKYYYHFEGNVLEPDANSAPNHILGYLHKYFQAPEPMPLVSSSSIKRYSAMDLDRAGMNFGPHIEDQNWALAMKLESLPLFPWFHNFMHIPQFSWLRRRTLRMPKVHISDYSELIFRNLIVYEQCSNVEKYVTAYITALDMLIDTQEDVALLEKSKVLISYFGSNEEAADMINKLCRNIDLEYYYDPLWDEIDAYYNNYWPHTVALLKRKYVIRGVSLL